MKAAARISCLAISSTLSALACGDDGTDTGQNTQAQTAPCYEWQRFMRHAGLDETQVAEGSNPGEYVFSNVGFFHAGSWELNFRASTADGTMDMFQVLLCVEGMLPFANCFDEDPNNDEDCEMPIDARCRGDEHTVDSTIAGHAGHFTATVVSIEPTPLMNDPATITVRLTDAGGQPITGATISRSECAMAMAMHHHEG